MNQHLDKQAAVRWLCAVVGAALLVVCAFIFGLIKPSRGGYDIVNLGQVIALGLAGGLIGYGAGEAIGKELYK